MCDEAVGDFQPTLNFLPDWFFSSKMIKKLFNTWYADENILYFDEDFGNAEFNCSDMSILNIDLNILIKNYTIFMLKMFQYPQTKICPSGQNVSISQFCVLLTCSSL